MFYFVKKKKWIKKSDELKENVFDKKLTFSKLKNIYIF